MGEMGLGKWDGERSIPGVSMDNGVAIDIWRVYLRSSLGGIIVLAPDQIF